MSMIEHAVGVVSLDHFAEISHMDHDEMGSLLLDTMAENAKLRELVQDMWFWGYEGHMSSESQEWQMKHIDGVLNRMRELECDMM